MPAEFKLTLVSFCPSFFQWSKRITLQKSLKLHQLMLINIYFCLASIGKRLAKLHIQNYRPSYDLGLWLLRHYLSTKLQKAGHWTVTLNINHLVIGAYFFQIYILASFSFHRICWIPSPLIPMFKTDGLICALSTYSTRPHLLIQIAKDCWLLSPTFTNISRVIYMYFANASFSLGKLTSTNLLFHILFYATILI